MHPMLPLASCLLVLGLQDRNRPPCEVVAFTEQATPIGGYFGRYPVPGEMNDSGKFVFQSDLQNPFGQNWYGSSIWSYAQGEASLIVKEDDPAPGFNQAWFNEMATFPDLSNDDRLAFHATLYGPFIGSNANTLWIGTTLDQSIVVQQGGPVHGLPNLLLGGQLKQPKFASSPSFAFWTDLTGQDVNSSNDFAAFVHDGETPFVLVREGTDLSDALPGVRPGPWDQWATPTLSFDGENVAYFSTGLFGANVHPEDNSAMISGVPGSLSVIARRGDPAPEMGDGVNYGPIGTPAVNGAGRIVFSAELNLQDYTYKAGEGLWHGTPGAFEAITRDLETLPGGYTVYSILAPTINDAGDIAFVARIDKNNSAAWAAVTWRDGMMRVVAASGAPAPFTEAGTVFGDDQNIQFVHLAPTGQIAFAAAVEGPNVPAGANQGLWATDRNGSLTLVARSADILQLNVPRVIESFYLPNPADSANGRSGTYNANNQLAFMAMLSGSTRALLIADLGDPCPVDFNDDGTVNTLDFLAYLNAWVAQDESADFDGNGTINTLDFLLFLNEWVLGCA